MAQVALNGFETSAALVEAYATLALAYRMENSANASMAELLGRPSREAANYGVSLALLTINAAIAEGWVRNVLVECLLSELEDVEAAKHKLGVTLTTVSDKYFTRYLSDIEQQGGWDRLKGQFALYRDAPLEGVLGKDLAEAINTLFVLRNVVAHGTTFILPAAKMPDDQKDLYPFAWQSKLHGAGMYLERQFKKGDFYANLGVYGVPGHFFEKTKELVKAVASHFGTLPERSARIAAVITGYQFGYRPVTG